MEEFEIRKYEGKPVYATGNDHSFGKRGVVYDGVFWDISIEIDTIEPYCVCIKPIKAKDIKEVRDLGDKASTLELSISYALQDNEERVTAVLPLIKRDK